LEKIILQEMIIVVRYRYNDQIRRGLE